MVDLKTNYLGLDLKNPAGGFGLTTLQKGGERQQLEEAGVSAHCHALAVRRTDHPGKPQAA